MFLKFMRFTSEQVFIVTSLSCLLGLQAAIPEARGKGVQMGQNDIRIFSSASFLIPHLPINDSEDNSSHFKFIHLPAP
jgi:hypothetical protein